MDTSYINDPWYFEKDWTFKTEPLGVPNSLDVAEEYELEDGTKLAVIVFSDDDGNVIPLALANVLANVKSPSNAHPLWKSLYGSPKEVKSPIECAEPASAPVGPSAPVKSTPPPKPSPAASMSSGSMSKKKKAKRLRSDSSSSSSSSESGSGKSDKDDEDEKLIKTKKRTKKPREGKDKKADVKTGKVKIQGSKGQGVDYDEETKRIDAWKTAHFWQRVEIDPRLVVEPSPEIRIREVNPEHVERLKESFLRTKSKNPNVSLVALGYKGPKLLSELIKCKLQAWEGLHTTQALSKLANKFEKNAFWHTYMADVYICDDTPDDRRILRLVGNLSNFKASVNLSKDFAQLLKMQHDQMFAERARLSLKDEEEIPEAFVAQMKKDWVYSTGETPSQIYSIWNLARNRGKLWNRIWRVVSGKVDNPELSKKVKFRPPRSCHHFNFMFGIEEETLVDLLDEVIRGECNTKVFMTKCIKVRAIKRIRREIIEWINKNDKVPPEMKTSEWEIASDRFKSISSDEFFEIWEQTFAGLKEREAPPATFWQQLEVRFKPDAIRLEAARESTGTMSQIDFPGVSVKVFQADYRECSRYIPTANYELVFHDTPYGMDLAPWDKALSKEDLELTIGQIFPHNVAKNHVYVAMVHFSQKPMFYEVLRDKGYQDIHECFWQKININVKGHQRYTFSVEHMIIAYYGGRRANRWNTNNDPMMRLNTIFGPVLKHKCLREDDKPVNPCEKPPYLCRIFAKHHVHPGNHVLVFGAGAGGDVLGALAAGCNVTAIERDIGQYPYLVSRLQRIAKELGVEKKDKTTRAWHDVLPMAMAGTTGIPTGFHNFFIQPWKYESPGATLELTPVLGGSSSSNSKGDGSGPEALPTISQAEMSVLKKDGDSCNECGNTVVGDALICKTCSGSYCQDCAEGVKTNYICKACA